MTNVTKTGATNGGLTLQKRTNGLSGIVPFSAEGKIIVEGKGVQVRQLGSNMRGSQEFLQAMTVKQTFRIRDSGLQATLNNNLLEGRTDFHFCRIKLEITKVIDNSTQTGLSLKP
jgi:hypothetical protein